jgi:hypothetical protein
LLDSFPDEAIEYAAAHQQIVLDLLVCGTPAGGGDSQEGNDLDERKKTQEKEKNATL